MANRLKNVICLSLLAVALADGVVWWGVANDRGVAHTTESGTCVGVCISESGYRFFWGSNRERGNAGFEDVRDPWRSVVFNSFPTSSDFLGFQTENLFSDWSEYEHPFPPPGTPRVHVRALWIPHWPVFTLAVGIPLLVRVLAARRRRFQERNPHLCPTCGYDLRAHRPGDKCPECGTVAPSRVPETQRLPRLARRGRRWW